MKPLQLLPLSLGAALMVACGPSDSSSSSSAPEPAPAPVASDRSAPPAPSSSPAPVADMAPAAEVAVSGGKGLDWPRWRGSDHTGISKETNWKHQWAGGRPKQLWKANVGTGYASMSVSQGRVFTMGHSSNKDRVVCLSLEDGKELWRHEYPADLKPNMYDGGPNATPTVDGPLVYSFSKKGNLFCLEAATGKVVWEANVGSLGAKQPSWGFSGSPLIEGDLVIVNAGTAGAAFNKKTGARAWFNGRDGAGYASPMAVDIGGKRQVLIFSAKHLLSVDPATGKGNWSTEWPTDHGVNAADPIVSGNVIFISSGYGQGATALDVSSGKPRRLWKNTEMKNHFNPSVLINGHLYGIDGNTGQRPALACMDIRTGRKKWSESRVGFGSLIASGNRLIVLNEKGELIIAQAGSDRFVPLARTQVLGGQCWTTPTLAHGRLLCRNSKGDLVCVDLNG